MTKAFKPKWQTWWLIAGPRLSQSQLVLFPGVAIVPLNDEDFEHQKLEGVPVPTIRASSDTFVVHYPPRDVIQSRYRLQIDVDEPSEARAVEQATDIANRLLTSLTLSIPGGRFHAEMRKIRQTGAKEEKSRWSQTVRVTPMAEPLPLTKGDLDHALKLYDQLGNDDIAENAYVHLLTAWQLHETAGSKPLMRSILQHYILCVEAVVNGVMSRVRSQSADKIRQAEREFADIFSRELPDRADKPKAIREASTNLRILGLQNTLPAIDMVASVLEISDSIKDQAKALYQFRSRNLSHPGRTKPQNFDQWLRHGPTVANLSAADTISRAFLTAYCTWRG